MPGKRSAQSDELTEFKAEVQHGQTLITQQPELIEIQSGQLAEQRRVASKQIDVLEVQRGELEASVAQREREAGESESAQTAMVTTWFSSRRIDATFYPGSASPSRCRGATAWGRTSATLRTCRSSRCASSSTTWWST